LGYLVTFNQNNAKMSFISIKEYADLTGIKRTEVYRFIREGRFDPKDIIRETRQIEVLKINENAKPKK
jgi:hypothetical protein